MEVPSVYGSTGFIGDVFCNTYPSVRISREQREPETKSILNFISTTHNYHVLDDSTADIETNLLVLMQMLIAAKKTYGSDFIFNHVSSWFVYGEALLPATEASECKPKGLYSLTKKMSEDLLINYCETFDIEWRILRLANVLGISDEGVSARKNATQFLLKKIISNEDIPLYYQGKFLREFIDVRDCVRAINLVLHKGNVNSIYNIGNGDGIEFIRVIKYAMEYTKSKSRLVDFKQTEFHEQAQVKSFYMSTKRLESLGYFPKYFIEDTLEWIIDYYKHG